MTRYILIAVVALSACATRAASRPVESFTDQTPQWCLDLLYKPTGARSAVGRVCVDKPVHCRNVRKGLLKYGRLAGVLQVSRCSDTF